MSLPSLSRQQRQRGNSLFGRIQGLTTRSSSRRLALLAWRVRREPGTPAASFWSTCLAAGLPTSSSTSTARRFRSCPAGVFAAQKLGHLAAVLHVALDAQQRPRPAQQVDDPDAAGSGDQGAVDPGDGVVAEADPAAARAADQGEGAAQPPRGEAVLAVEEVTRARGCRNRACREAILSRDVRLGRLMMRADKSVRPSAREGGHLSQLFEVVRFTE